MGSALGKSSKHDIQNNHTINMMVATAPVANALGIPPNGFCWVFCASTNIPPNGLDDCLCQQRAESPMVSIAQGNALGKRYLDGYAL